MNLVIIMCSCGNPRHKARSCRKKAVHISNKFQPTEIYLLFILSSISQPRSTRHSHRRIPPMKFTPTETYTNQTLAFQSTSPRPSLIKKEKKRNSHLISSHPKVLLIGVPQLGHILVPLSPLITCSVFLSVVSSSKAAHEMPVCQGMLCVKHDFARQELQVIIGDFEFRQYLLVKGYSAPEGQRGLWHQRKEGRVLVRVWWRRSVSNLDVD